MTGHHKRQNQHRVSQVYLKGFGYQKGDDYFVSVMSLKSNRIENLSINTFLSEVNLFDLPFEDYTLKRHFETLTSIVENHYPRVISNLKNQKQLIPKDKDVLNHFTASILCRSKKMREFFTWAMSDDKTRIKLFKEVTALTGDYNEINSFIRQFNLSEQLNVFTGFAMNHFVELFRSFKKVIIKADEFKGWITTDNGVLIDKQGKDEWIIPLEAEIYFPLSKDFCLFMYNENSQLKNNPLRELTINKIHSIDEDSFEKLSMKIGFGVDEYLILNTETEDQEI